MAIRLVSRLVLLAGVSALLVAAVSLRGGSTGITFAQANGFNLTIDSHSTYNGVLVPSATWGLKNLTPGTDKFFNINDVKPGDRGETTISFHVNMDAWLCMDFQNLQNKENGINEPESHVDSTPTVGELADGTEFFAWRDDGDNVFEVGEVPLFGTSTQAASIVLNNKKYALADAEHPSPLVASSTAYVGITWCAGNLSVNLGTAAITCDGSVLGNAAQTDSMSVDISFRAVTTDQTDFRCEDPSGGSGGSQGMGEKIGLFVKCEMIAKYGWPLPMYKTECPGGFGTQPTQSTAATQTVGRTDRGTSTQSPTPAPAPTTAPATTSGRASAPTRSR